MKKATPTSLQNGVITKDKYKERQAEEERLKGSKTVSKTPPPELCDKGKKAYKEIINSLPDGFLSNLDLNILVTCADAIANMQKCREMLNEQGVLIESPQGAKQNPVLLAYTKYSDMFRKYADDLGLSPSARSKLALMKQQQKEKKEDPLLKILKKA